MKLVRSKQQGFSVIELFITAAVVIVLGIVALRAFNDYKLKSYYGELVQAAAPYRVAVGECARNLGTVTGCSAGLKAIPKPITKPVGAVASLSVINGVITATPVPNQYVTASDTYILTPTMAAGNAVTWKVSGGGVAKGYTQ